MKYFIIYLVCICLAFKISAQKSSDSLSFKPEYKRDQKYTFKTNYGSVFVGYVVKETENEIRIEKNNPYEFINLKKSEIDNVKKYSKSKKIKVEDDDLEENQPSNNYLLVSSAFLLQKEKVTTISHWLLLENIDFAFNKNWSVTSTSFAFFPISIGFKCVYQLNKRNYLGFNAFGFGDIFNSIYERALWGYGSSFKYSSGNIDKNFTLSAGLLGLQSDIFLKNTKNLYSNLGFVNAAYYNKLSSRLAFTAEAWYFPTIKTGLVGLGIKLINNPRISWTFGCFALDNNFTITNTLLEKPLPLPYIGIMRIF